MDKNAEIHQLIIDITDRNHITWKRVENSFIAKYKKMDLELKIGFLDPRGETEHLLTIKDNVYEVTINAPELYTLIDMKIRSQPDEKDHFIKILKEPLVLTRG